MKIRSSEHLEQKAYFEWCRWMHYDFIFAIPNGTRCSPQAKKWMLDEGLTPGVPDVFCAMPSFQFAGLFLEFKWGKNRQTKEQKVVEKILTNNRYLYKVVYGSNEAINFTINYLNT